MCALTLIALLLLLALGVVRVVQAHRGLKALERNLLEEARHRLARTPERLRPRREVHP